MLSRCHDLCLGNINLVGASSVRYEHRGLHNKQAVSLFYYGTGMHQQLIGPEESERLKGILEGLQGSQEEDSNLLKGKLTPTLCAEM